MAGNDIHSLNPSNLPIQPALNDKGEE